MTIQSDVLEILRCPICNARLDARSDAAVCQGSTSHIFPIEEGFVTFARLDPGKYDDTYAAQYAGLWAFGYLALHKGLDEPLYRTVSSLVAECLIETAAVRGSPLIVDCGCGVGRVAADCATLAPHGWILGFDGSISMLKLADRILHGTAPIELSLGKFGYEKLSIEAHQLRNVFLARADVELLPLDDACADIVLSINIVDRLRNGPEPALRQCRRILRSQGHLIFTNPLNWIEPWLWEKYGSGDTLLTLIRDCGFRIETWFDQLVYREILDRRGATEEFPTLVVLGTAVG